MRSVLVTFLLAGAFCSGCGYAPFTHSLRGPGALDDERLRAVQFYMSDKCVFERRVNTMSGEVAHGKLEMRQGRAIDVVRVPKHTPGVVEAVWPDKLSVSFEPGTWFYFGTRPNEGPNSKYYLLGRFDGRSRRFAVMYAGLEYYQTTDDVCYLEVRRSLSRSKAKEKTTLRGRRLGE
jgi:hypothetical protein